MSQLQEDQLFANRYRLIKKLGSGSFGDVWLADYKGVQVAVKIYNQLDEQGLEDFLSEFKISYSLNHTNLLHITNYDVYGNNPYLVMPYCSNGSCKKFIGNIDEETAWRFIRDVSGGLSYLHKLNPPIIHQDIKPDNVLISETGDFVITDFGISKRIRSTLNKSVRNISAGTRAYMGPERYSKTPAPIKASDIWSLGATVYELMTGEVPFGEIGGGMQKGGADIPDIEGNYSNLLKQTVEACLAKDPWDRPTAEQLKDYAEKVLKGETPKAPWQSKVQEHPSSSQDLGRPTQRITPSPPQDKEFGRTTQRKSEQEQIAQEPEQQTIVAKKGNTKLLWLWIALGVVALGGLILFLTTIGQDKPQDNAPVAQLTETKTDTIIQVVEVPSESTVPMENADKDRIAQELEQQRKAEQERIAQEQERQRKAEQERIAQEQQRKAEQIRNIQMVYVSGGTFTMGCTSEQGSECYGGTQRVTLSSFYIGKYEVTQAQWEAVMGSNPSLYKGDNLPVERVSWDDIQDFIRKLNAQTGKRYRLPTEAEWEFAARGGNQSSGTMYSGSNSIDNVGWYYENSGGKTHQVGQKSPNELGIYDMTGNVWEWCSDWYGSYSSSSQINPKGPSSGSYRVLRGGSWAYYAKICRVSLRGNYTPDSRYSDYGFRLALVP